MLQKRFADGRALPGAGAGPMGRVNPVLVYDAQCGFCRKSLRLAQRWFPNGWDAVSSATESFGLNPTQLATSVWWVETDAAGALHHYRGHRAVAALLTNAGGRWALFGRLLQVPPMSWCVELAYRLVARNRSRLPGGCQPAETQQ